MRYCFYLLFCLLFFNPSFAQDAPILQLDTGGHTALIKDVAFTPDGRYLVSAGDDKTIRVWDWRQGKTVRFLRGQIGQGHEGKIFAMALSPNGQWLAVGGWLDNDNRDIRHAIRLYNFSSGKLIALLKGHRNVVHALAFSPNSQQLLSGSFDKTAILWDIATQRQLRQLKGHSDHIYAVAFTADNQRVVTGSFDHTLRLWQVATGDLIATLQGHTDKVYAVAVSPKNDLIASGSWDYTIRLWNSRTGKFIRTLADQGTQIGNLSFSPNGKFLLSGVTSAPFNSYLWDIASGKKQYTYRKHDNIVLATAFSPNGRYAVTAGGGNHEIHIWDRQSGKTIQTLAGQGAAVWSVGFAKNGQSIAWGKESNYKSANHRGALQYQLTLGKNTLGTPQPLKNKAWQRAQTKKGNWSLRTKKGGNYGYQAILEIIYQGQVKARIKRGLTDGYDHRSYTFTSNGKQIISGGMGGALSLYQRKGKKIGDFIGHTGDVWAVAVSPNGKTLISGSWDQTVRLWDIQSQELLLTLFTGKQGDWIAWTPQGYYSSSPNGDQLIGWQINRGADKAADYVDAKQLRQQFYRPDIITATLRLGSAKKAIAQARNSRYSLANFLKKGLPPKFNLIHPQDRATVANAKQEITLSFASDAKADSIEAYVNGRQVISRGKDALLKQMRGFQENLTLPLDAGENNIRIVAHNAIGQTERNFTLFYKGRDKHQQGRLFIVAIGVSDYNDNDLDLNFAAKDATAFYNRLTQQAKKNHQSVKGILVADGHQTPTAANITDALDLFENSNENDTVVLFLAGHGINKGMDYYFLAKNAEKKGNSWRSSTVVKWNNLLDNFSNSKGRRIMFVDTCFAGNAFNPRLFNDGANKNIVMISATDGLSLSFEQTKLGHGNFTYALLEALSDKGDYERDQAITLQEIGLYLSKRIPQISNDAQTPVLNLPQGFKDFDFMHL